MLLKGIDHITINMIDADRSFDFYEKVLGLKKISSVHMGDHTLNYMELPGECRLELIEYHSQNRVIETKNTDLGIYRHVAFVVDNVEEIKSKCDKYNIKINLLPLYIDKLNCKILLIEDPNGVEIELMEKIQ